MHKLFPLLTLPIIIASCQNAESDHPDAKITLGDSATIVTETDSQYLTNNFDDLTIKPQIEKKDSQLKVVDTPKIDSSANIVKTENLESNSISNNGYALKLKNSTLILEGKTEKQFRKSSENSYVVNKQNYPTKVISKNGEGTIKTRVVSVAYYKKDGQRIRLNDLGESRSEWKVNKSQSGVFNIDKLSSASSFKNANAATIQKSINNGINKLKINQIEKNKLSADIKKINSLQHSNIEIVTEKAEWDININGKSDNIYFTF